ncbi:uncharacterized protein MEPE_06626 [Melanopsichium pennsylvanicum]|uniref:Cation/H+ exchanger transmembrane domain-containing protein n=2 Tax=Melanopsichium pennsylvanicum TaxID=63383 RepID=A0AAJ5C8E4_9BASI|nr:na h exchanger family protein [Melanopsichium pennsylvanicum 4]SNX87915.1 uncharacterized protein MEPE_06626 [Melanopsichium pennsylvanicum]
MVISMDAVPYTSPSIVTVLVLASYLLLLSIFYHAFQLLLSAGILGPLVLGAIYASPLANILPDDVQSAILAIGYLGLILLIVKGGVEARIDILSSPKNLVMALLVGSTGLIVPIGISMALLPLGFGYKHLESFAIGAALASTSLGTTFAVLSSCKTPSDTSQNPANENPDKAADHGIADTRIGTILVGAALLDDIVGLVITSVISILGSASDSITGITSIEPWIIARPIVSSFLLLVITWLLTQFVLAPIAKRVVIPYLDRLVQASQTYSLRGARSAEPQASNANKLLARFVMNQKLQQFAALTMLTSVVLAYSVISEEIGSSLLIGAFCSGALMKYMYSLWGERSSAPDHGMNDNADGIWSPDYLLSTKSSLGVVQNTLLMPFFFSSIGSAIPVKSMFEGTTVWRGIIFAGLMAFAKVCAGGWVFLADVLEQKWSDRHAQRQTRERKSPVEHGGETSEPVGGLMDLQPGSAALPPQQTVVSDPASQSSQSSCNEAQHVTDRSLPTHAHRKRAPKAPVWPVSLFLGTALMSRGEIGFLVINIAKQGDLIGQQAFNVGIWAIVLNTLAGPISIGILMRTRHGQSIIKREPNSQPGRWG